MKQKKTMPRALSLVLALLLLLSLTALFAGCSGGATKVDRTYKEGETAEDYFARLLALGSKDTGRNAREEFVAASRGYNMSAEGFDKNADAPDLGVVDLAGAKAALALVAPEDAYSLGNFNAFQEALTAEQVDVIVTKMASEVDLAKTTGFSMILVWIGKFLQILTNITGHNYVGGLLVFAVIVELLLLPFAIKQQKNSQKQAKLRPKEMAIRKKYAGRNDQKSMQAMQQDIQKLYQDEGFNPMGGCLPLLIQMPIVIVLYNIVVDPLRYVLGKAVGLTSALSTYCTTARAAGGLGIALGDRRGSIELLSKVKDNLGGFADFRYFSNAGAAAAELEGVAVPDFSLFGIPGTNMGEIPSITNPSWLWLIPVLTFVFYFFSMKLNRKFMYQPMAQDPQVGCSNNMMDVTMPLMSVYIAFIVPAALGIYWMFKSVLSTLKQFIIHKTMPLPACTEEDIKNAEKELKGKYKPAPKPAGTRTTTDGRQIRSLHYIDEDDYDELPEVKKQNNTKKTTGGIEPPEIKD